MIEQKGYMMAQTQTHDHGVSECGCSATTAATYDCGCGFTIYDDTDDVAGFYEAIADHEQWCDGLMETEQTAEMPVVTGRVVEDWPVDELVQLACDALNGADAITLGYLDRLAARADARRGVIEMFAHHADRVNVELTPYERLAFDYYSTGRDDAAEHALLLRWEVEHKLAPAGAWTP